MDALEDTTYGGATLLAQDWEAVAKGFEEQARKWEMLYDAVKAEAQRWEANYDAIVIQTTRRKDEQTDWKANAIAYQLEADRWKEIVSESQETLNTTIRRHRIETETLTKIIIDLARELGGDS